MCQGCNFNMGSRVMVQPYQLPPNGKFISQRNCSGTTTIFYKRNSSSHLRTEHFCHFYCGNTILQCGYFFTVFLNVCGDNFLLFFIIFNKLNTLKNVAHMLHICQIFALSVMCLFMAGHLATTKFTTPIHCRHWSQLLLVNHSL